MDTVTVNELARVLAERKKLEESVARSFVSTMFDVVRVALERDKLVKVKGLGTFKLVEVSARESVNVNSGERMVIGSYAKITFTPDSIMKEIVNKPFSQFETVVLNDGVEFEDMDQSADGQVAEPEVPSDGDAIGSATDGGDDGDSATDACSDVAGNAVEAEGDDCGAEPGDVAGSGVEPEAESDELASDAGGSSAEDTVSAEPVDGDGGCDAVVAMPGSSPGVGDAGGCGAAGDSVGGHAHDAAPEYVSDENGVRAESVGLQEVTDVCQTDASLPGEGRETVPGGVVCAAEPGSGQSPRKSRGAVKAVLTALLVLLLMAASAYGGYLYGLYEAYGPSLAKKGAQDGVSVAARKGKEPKPATALAKAERDTVKALPAVKDTVAKAAQAAKPEEEGKGEKAATKAGAREEERAKPFDSSKYDAMDSRVRTGAYRIIGTDRVVTVKQGETLQRISDRLLGPGMECYVEVYNGLSGQEALKAGQSLRIPKLELRKRRR